MGSKSSVPHEDFCCSKMDLKMGVVDLKMEDALITCFAKTQNLTPKTPKPKTQNPKPSV